MDIQLIKNKKIVCLGGGIGTVNLIKGLSPYTEEISVIVSMADEGGSSGRLRRLYNIFPPGDLVSCMAAVASHSNPLISDLLTYRFPGNRYGRDHHLAGHKLGNLIMVALRDITGDFHTAVDAFKKMFNVRGVFLPATNEPVSISAQTIEGQIVQGEEVIDLGKYTGKRVLEKVFIHPENPLVTSEVINAIEGADVIIAGPGDLYTTILPVLIIPKIKEAIAKSRASKFFVVNVANKPFETKGYSIQNFIAAIDKNVGEFPFTHVIVNSNFTHEIPKPYKYDYVKRSDEEISSGIHIVEADLVNEEFPLYHSSDKLAKVVVQNI